MAAPVNSVGKRQHARAKRPVSDASAENVSRKKPRVNSFDHIEFKSYLKEPQMASLGFEKFVEAAASHTDGGGEDIVLKFLHSSPECSEIFHVLEVQQKKVHELQLIFKCLETILLRIADDLGQFYKSGQNIVKKLLAGHVLSIFNTLNIKNKSNQIKTSLKLFIAMVMLGGPTTKLVLNNVDLSHKAMVPLLQRRDVKDEEDVRTCFIHLIVACLLAGDNDAIKKLVQTKGTVPAGPASLDSLCEKAIQPVHGMPMVLLRFLFVPEIMHGRVINEYSNQQDTQRFTMFSEKSLKELGRSITGIGSASGKQNSETERKTPILPYMETDDMREDKVIVAELVHKFLTEVCTSFKHGIIFHDKSYGQSARTNPFDELDFRNLCGNLSNDCCEGTCIVLKYLLLQATSKIYSSVRSNIPILHMKEKKNVGNMVHILMMYTMPTSQILKTILPGVKDKSLVVNHVTLGLVKQMADTARHVLKLIQNLPSYTPHENLAIHTTYKALVIKNLPDVMDILNCLDRIMQTTSQVDIDKVQEFCGIGLCEVMIQLEQILCLYQDFQPTLLAEHPTILGKLIEGIMEKEWRSVTSSSYHLMKVHLLKLMAGTESRRLPWAKQNASGQSLLHQLLAMLTQLSSNRELADMTLQLVCKLLESTDQFENHHNDLLVWLNALLHSQTDVLDFVSKVMITYIHNPYPYMDRMCDLQLTSDLNMASTSEEKQPFDSEVFAQKKFPFCPMLIVGLDVLEKSETIPKELQEYISRVLLGTFHQQTCPVALCTLLAKYRDSLFLPGLLDYILTWIKGDEKTTDILPTKSMYQNFLSKNPDFLTGESSPMFTIQQDLLHLTYIIKHSQKFEIKVKASPLFK
ncbi:nucleolar pre-ribosomal-associated protein 1-like [Ruditapes philippinarum]|uniref:nucleolar pre-ribosomal-associated protein 1-like n=1 Tax=Ruditapes philippinarum TaxID=129788 RepID=UPI00295B16F5|nr:nucleolar pre-ribosomal-associated protein 1-like [Ruditapes philippinarum]